MYTHSNQERVLGVLAGVSCDGDVQVVQGGAGGDRDLGDCDDHDHDRGDRVVQGGGYVEGMGGANCNFRVHNPTSGKFSYPCHRAICTQVDVDITLALLRT